MPKVPPGSPGPPFSPRPAPSAAPDPGGFWSTRPAGPEDQVLACGVGIGDLIDQLDAGQLEPVDRHQAQCGHCRRELRAMIAGRRALDLLRAEPGPTPAGLADRVIRTIRATEPAPPPLELPTPGPQPVAGHIRVHRRVVAEVARTAAASHSGVTVARSTVAAPGLGGGLTVALGLLVDGQTPLPRLARAVRRSVRGALRQVTGVRDIRVDLTALDLVPGAAHEVEGGA